MKDWILADSWTTPEDNEKNSSANDTFTVEVCYSSTTLLETYVKPDHSCIEQWQVTLFCIETFWWSRTAECALYWSSSLFCLWVAFSVFYLFIYFFQFTLVSKLPTFQGPVGMSHGEISALQCWIDFLFLPFFWMILRSASLILEPCLTYLEVYTARIGEFSFSVSHS